MLGEVQVRSYENARFNLGQLGVDAYMVQHPGVPSPQSIQSVTVHLISLCLQLEHGVDAEASRAAMSAVERHKQDFTWLVPPASSGDVTIMDMRDTSDRSTSGRSSGTGHRASGMRGRRITPRYAPGWRGWDMREECSRAATPAEQCWRALPASVEQPQRPGRTVNTDR
jgi:hypothetical protein